MGRGEKATCPFLKGLPFKKSWLCYSNIDVANMLLALLITKMMKIFVIHDWGIPSKCLIHYKSFCRKPQISNEFRTIRSFSSLIISREISHCLKHHGRERGDTYLLHVIAYACLRWFVWIPSIMIVVRSLSLNHLRFIFNKARLWKSHYILSCPLTEPYSNNCRPFRSIPLLHESLDELAW